MDADTDPPPAPRVAALGEQLAEVHDRLRERVEILRDSLATTSGYAARDLPAPPPDLRADLGADLRAHCLAFCHALTAHHEGEDDGLFAQLRRAEPALGPTIDKLVEDHHLISGILERVEALTRSGGERARLVGELDGLTAIMNSHFAYEERSITAAIDRLGATVAGRPWSAAVFTA